MPYLKNFYTVRLYTTMGLLIFMMTIIDLPSVLAAPMSMRAGHVEGQITFVGKLPQIRKFNLATYPDPYYCGRVSDGKGWRIGPRAIVSADSHLTGAIVFIRGVKTIKQPDNQSNTVKSLDCRFTPFIGLLRTGDTLKFENWDPVLHQIEIFQVTTQGGRLLFRQDLLPLRESLKSDFLQSEGGGTHQSGTPLSYKINDEGILFFRCPLHEYMEAWAMALSHQFFSISSIEGNFSIADIPIGTYTLVVWHPIGQTERTIHVVEHHTLRLNLKFQPTRSTFYREPEVKTNPFGIDLLGDTHIIPSVEEQKE